MWNRELLSPQDEPYEIEVAKNPQNYDSWMKYVRYKQKSGFQNQVFVLERAVRRFPEDEPLWDLYLQTCMRELQQPTPQASTQQVNRIFQRLLAVFSSKVAWWLKYLRFLVSTQIHKVALIRRTFNECLYNTDVDDHALVWPLYLEFANTAAGITGANIYRKFLCYASLEQISQHDDSIPNCTLEDVVARLVEFSDVEHSKTILDRILENAALSSALSTSPLHFVLQYIGLLSKWAVEPKTDKIIQDLVKKSASKYKDLAGLLDCKLAEYFNRRQETDKARQYYEEGLQKCATAEEFTELYDSYTAFEEEYLLNLADGDPDIMEAHLQRYETLLDQRSILLNDVFIRQDENNIDYWFDRIAIYNNRDDTNSVLTTYATALTKINPLKAYSLSKHKDYSLPKLWTNYAQVYSSHKDFNTADFIFAKAVKTSFRNPDDLAQIYIEWSRLWLEKDFPKSIAILQTVLDNDRVPTENLDYHDSSVPVSDRIVKSSKLWSYFLDLLESNIDFEKPEENKSAIKDVEDGYNRMIQLKIATPLTIINFASFYEELNFFERSFTVYELGLSVFKDSRVKFEIWNVYLSKLLKRNVSKERMRELFETALHGPSKDTDECPADLCKPIVLLYSQFEHDNGMVLKSIKVLHDGIAKLSTALHSKEKTDRKGPASQLLDDKVALYNVLLISIEKLGDNNLCRQTYEDCLQDTDLKLSHLVRFTLRFILYETELGELNRARALFKYICGLGHPEAASLQLVWEQWQEFELKNGNETTFKDMLRFRRSVKESSETEEHVKLGINPLGFVKGTKKRPREEDYENPDTISIDME